MFTSTPRDELAVVHERGRRLRAEAEAERARGPSPTRRAVAMTLRRAADRLDRASLVRVPASQP